MKDADLRSALLRFFEDQSAQSDRLVDRLAIAKENRRVEDKIDDILDGHMNFLQNFQRASKQLLQALESEQRNNRADEETPRIATELPQLAPYEQELVAAYNDEPGKWVRKFRPTGFGAENVNEIWGKGGEPKFARKEGGIYNLIEADGVCYVVPEPGLRLQESYFRSEGLRYLFQVTGSSIEAEPLIALIRPAKVEESGGRWTILSRGEIRGRT